MSVLNSAERMPTWPFSMRLIFDAEQSSTAATCSRVLPAASRSACRARPSCRFGTVGLAIGVAPRTQFLRLRRPSLHQQLACARYLIGGCRNLHVQIYSTSAEQIYSSAARPP